MKNEAKMPWEEKEAIRKSAITIEIDAKRELDGITPGTPTADHILLKVNLGDIHKDNASGRDKLDQVVFEVMSIGPDIKNEVLKSGVAEGKQVFVQTTASVHMARFDWGSGNNILIKEYEVQFVFDRNPFDLTAKTVLKHKAAYEAEFGVINNPKEQSAFAAKLGLA